MRQALRIALMLVMSVLLLALVVHFVGFHETYKAVEEAGFLSFGVVGALTLLYLVLQSLVLDLLNRPIGHRIRFATLLEASTVAFAGNVLSPFSYLGGEPLKIVYVARAAAVPYHEVAGTVLLAKYLEGISMAIFFSIGAVVATISYRDALFGPNLPIGIAIVVAVAALLALSVAVITSMLRRWQPLTQVARLFARIPFLTRRMAKLVEKMGPMEDQISRVFREEGVQAWKAFAVQGICHVSIFVKPALFFSIGIGLHLTFAQLCLFYIATQVLLGVQLTPLGAGTLDTGLIGMFALMGLTGEDSARCMAFLLCLRFWDVVLIAIGAWIAGKAGAKLLTQKKEPALAGLPNAEAPGDPT